MSLEGMGVEDDIGLAQIVRGRIIVGSHLSYTALSKDMWKQENHLAGSCWQYFEKAQQCLRNS